MEQRQLFTVRHGETDWNGANFRGHIDVPLNKALCRRRTAALLKRPESGLQRPTVAGLCSAVIAEARVAAIKEAFNVPLSGYGRRPVAGVGSIRVQELAGNAAAVKLPEARPWHL